MFAVTDGLQSHLRLQHDIDTDPPHLHGHEPRREPPGLPPVAVPDPSSASHQPPLAGHNVGGPAPGRINFTDKF